MNKQEQIDKLKTAEERYTFSIGPRGQYIISQALYLGIQRLKEVEPAHMREESNIKDMEYLAELYPLYFDIADSLKGLEEASDFEPEVEA